MRNTALSGTMASVFSAAVLAWAGHRHIGSAVAPINAPAHWIWGDESLRRNNASLRHTLSGALIHHASSLLWAALFEWARSRRSSEATTTAVLDAAAVTALACVVDLKLVPQRLTPGFERRIPRRNLAMVYVAFAAGLAAAAALRRR
jgi:hypothetical protein